MAKFEVTHGKAVKAYDKETGKPICYEIGDVVEADKMPSNLLGKCRELAEKPAPKKQRLTTHTKNLAIAGFFIA